MTLSPTGRELEAKEEGLVLHPYDDAGGAAAVLAWDPASKRYLDRQGHPPRGYATVGVGHRIKAGEVFGAITEARAWSIFDEDSAEVMGAINRWFDPRRVTPHMVDALADFGLNCGVGALEAVAPFAATGDTAGAVAHMGLYVHGVVDGKKVVLPVLVRRRAVEAALYLDPMPAALSPEDVAEVLARVYQTSSAEVGEEEIEHGRANVGGDGGDDVDPGAEPPAGEGPTPVPEPGDLG